LILGFGRDKNTLFFDIGIFMIHKQQIVWCFQGEMSKFALNIF